MPTWNDVRLEIERTRLPNGNLDFDTVRRGKIGELANHTGRPLLVYASDFLNQAKMPLAGQEINLDLRDKDGFLECTQRIPGEALDVLVHSPGGLAEAAESIVKILRQRFRDIRFIVPNMAKSAATMLVFSGNQIVMDAQGELGPTDPQFFIPRGDGTVVFAPAQAIIDQFETAEAVLKSDPKTATSVDSHPAPIRPCPISTVQKCDQPVEAPCQTVVGLLYVWGAAPTAGKRRGNQNLELLCEP